MAVGLKVGDIVRPRGATKLKLYNKSRRNSRHWKIHESRWAGEWKVREYNDKDSSIVKFTDKGALGQYDMNITSNQLDKLGDVPWARTAMTGMQKELSKLVAIAEQATAEAKEMRSRIQFMKDNNLSVFNETEYKAFRIIELMESDEEMDHLKKAKLIASLVTNEVGNR